MGAFIYYLTTAVEAALGAVGIRGLYEQPPYTVVEHLPGRVEVRDYPPRVAAETDDDGSGSAAFNRLFGYITGGNLDAARISMTAPVSQRGTLISMTVPVQSNRNGGVMRFFLPRAIAEKGAPAPLDPAVRIVTVPAERLAVLRFSGSADRASVDAQERLLMDDVAKAGRKADGAPFLLTYDAPFTIPFVRRNEVAVALTR